MSLDAHRQSIENTFAQSVAASYPSVPVKYANVPFVQPETAWFAIHLVEGNSLTVNLGRGKQVDRHVGLVQVDALVPELTGSSNANIMAEWSGKIWRLQAISLPDGAVVRYRTPRFVALGCQNGFHRMAVQIPYWRDEPAQ